MIASKMRPAFLFVLALAAVLGPTPARAGLVLQVGNSSPGVGGIGTFDVVLRDTGGTFAVGGFSVELRVAPGSGVNFTAVDGKTVAAPYLFGTVQMPPLSLDGLPTKDLSVLDSDAAPPGFITLNPGDVYGMEHVTYLVAPGTPPGAITVSIVGLTGPAPTTQVDDVAGLPFAFTATNGTISVTAAVPEPCSLWLSSTALIGISLIVRSRKARR